VSYCQKYRLGKYIGLIIANPWMKMNLKLTCGQNRRKSSLVYSSVFLIIWYCNLSAVLTKCHGGIEYGKWKSFFFFKAKLFFFFFLEYFIEKKTGGFLTNYREGLQVNNIRSFHRTYWNVYLSLTVLLNRNRWVSHWTSDLLLCFHPV